MERFFIQTNFAVSARDLGILRHIRNVDCLARHSILSGMSIVELDIECSGECRLSSLTFAKIRLQKFGHIANSNVDMNADCRARQ